MGTHPSTSEISTKKVREVASSNTPGSGTGLDDAGVPNKQPGEILSNATGGDAEPLRTPVQTIVRRQDR